MVGHAREARLRMRVTTTSTLFPGAPRGKSCKYTMVSWVARVSCMYCEQGSVCITVIYDSIIPMVDCARASSRGVARGYAVIERGAGCVIGLPAPGQGHCNALQIHVLPEFVPRQQLFHEEFGRLQQAA
jgi:hypothetical protein